MLDQIVAKNFLFSILVLGLSLSCISSDPVPEEASADWSTRISDNGESIVPINGPNKYSFDDSAEEIDSSLSKRETPPVPGPLDAPLVWGARLESSVAPSPSPTGISVSAASPSSVGNVEGSSVTAGSGTGSGSGVSLAGVGGGIGIDSKQKVDWALNPIDNKKLYSSNDAPDAIEQKKEETVALAPETSKQSDEANPDPYKDILPAVLTGKRRLVEGDKTIPSTPVVTDHVVPAPGTVKVSSPVASVDVKGHSGGSVYPDQGGYLKSNDKTIPQHVYTEDQFPSVIIIKGREYLVIPHNKNTARPTELTQSAPGVNSYWISTPGAVQGSHIQNQGFDFHLKSPPNAAESSFFSYYPSFQSTRLTAGPEPSQTSESLPSGHQFIPTFSKYHQSQSQFDVSPPHHPSIPSPPSSSGFTFSGQYPVYHSSAFNPPNVQPQSSSQVQSQRPSPGQLVNNGVSSVFSSFFPAYGQYPASGIKNYEFFTPNSHTVSISSAPGNRGVQGNQFSSKPSVGVSAVNSFNPDIHSLKSNPSLIPDPSFSPKLQDPVSASPADASASPGRDFFSPRPSKPESNLHAPPQVPSWNPYEFPVVAGSYPVQSQRVPSPSASPAAPPKTPRPNEESPVTVTVDTKFATLPAAPSSSSVSNNGVKGGSFNTKSASPSVTVGSFNLNSVSGEPQSTKGQSPIHPQPQQQPDQRVVGLAGETSVPTPATFVENGNSFLPHNSNPFLSSTGWMDGPMFPQFAPPNSFPSPAASPFADQGHFFAQPWHSAPNYPVPASSPSRHFTLGPSSPFYETRPHYARISKTNIKS